MNQKDLERELPSSSHTEAVILGSMLLETSELQKALDALAPDDFFLDSHQRIFTAIKKLHGDGVGIDSTTVRNELKRKRELESVGGPGYIAFLTEGIPRRLESDSYIKIVKDMSLLRSVMVEARNAFMDAADNVGDAKEIAARYVDRLQSLAEEREDEDLQLIGDYLRQQGPPESIYENLATTEGLLLGFSQLDKILGGLQNGDLIIVAARPAMGKTAWACCVAWTESVLKQKRVAFFTLEQNKKSMVRRMLSQSTRIDYKRIREGDLTVSDKQVIAAYRDRLADAPLYIDDRHGLTASRIRSKCRKLKRQKGSLDLVLIDQLSHVDSSDVYQKGMPKHEQVGAQTRAFKAMAKELGCPVVVLNQLRRPDGKGPVVPSLTDLKVSGNIEEDADIVIFLHRPEYYDRKDAELTNKGEQIVAKNREGETGTAYGHYQGRILRWEDCGKDQQEVSSPEPQHVFDDGGDRVPW